MLVSLYTLLLSSITGVVSMRIWGFREITPPLGRGDFPETPKSALRTTPVILLRNTSGQPPVVHSHPVSRQSCTHTPAQLGYIYRCSKLQNFEQHPKAYPIEEHLLGASTPEPWMWHPFHLVILTGTIYQPWCKTRSLRWYISNC